MNKKELLTLWEQVDALAHPLLAPIKNDIQHQDALSFVAELWGEVAQDEDSPYGSLFSIVIKNIAEYEASLQLTADTSSVQVLNALIAEQDIEVVKQDNSIIVKAKEKHNATVLYDILSSFEGPITRKDDGLSGLAGGWDGSDELVDKILEGSEQKRRLK